ncbi:OmpP1/FadL family transporter [Methylobacterium dankookense]|uniref:47 kDa outer membrane protein n=1 Tax=Methylobacterium dankookense TaxID=560405 RepID=A0A564FZ32_9HYPH|nr:outer membrane protein transport protein [Methylobacterium dankookense]GJD57857.1 47 kDa outer membrane protein [Methylobacterium dankookense]VUF13405.1 47 kDa outer membrane protein [Methylobacterium dankookense]
MTVRVRSLVLAGVAAAALWSGTREAGAGAFGIREQSTQAQGLSFAGAASGSGGVSSMFWNPAVITMNPGWVTEQNLTFINLSSEIRPTIGTNPGFLPLGGSGEIGQGAVVPAGATSYQLSDRLWIGLQTGAPFGLVTKPNQTWAGEVYGRSSRIFSLAFNPVIGFKVNEWLSVAAGPNIEYFRLTLRQALPIPGLLPTAYPSAFLKGESWGVGFTAGATITPWAGTVLGIGYRSSVHHDIEGSIGVPLVALARTAGQVTANLNTPEKLSVGLTQAINPVTRINLGFEWDNWTRLGNVGIVSRTLGVPVSNLPLDYKDGFTYSIGAEYDWSPSLTLRGGFAYEVSPIDFANRSVRLPDGDRYIASIGASYRWNEKLTLNLAYSHFFLDRNRILSGPGRDYNVANLAFAGYADASADVVSVGFRYVFGEPARPVEAAPLIRKY